MPIMSSCRWPPLREDSLRSSLQARRRHVPVHVAAVTGSTQDDALDRLKAGAEHGSVFVAEHQLSGRGRLGRSWLTTPGNLLFSLVVRNVNTDGDLAGLLTIAASVGVARAIEQCVGVALLIKWPNDLMLANAKVGGVLISVRQPHAVIGVGINVGTAPGIVAAQPTSAIAEYADQAIDRTELLAFVIDEILSAVEAKASLKTDLFNDWVARSTVLGHEVEVSGTVIDRGRVAGFDRDGSLLLQTVDGAMRKIRNGDVSLRGDT